MLQHAFQTFTASMPRRVNQLLLLATALLGTAATIAAFSHGVTPVNIRSSATGAVTTPVVAPRPQSAATPMVLPTIVVTSPSEPTTLATITVRPIRVAPAAGDWKRVGDFTLGAIDSPHVPISTPAGGGLAMPYYSFSRSPRRANKE